MCLPDNAWERYAQVAQVISTTAAKVDAAKWSPNTVNDKLTYRGIIRHAASRLSGVVRDTLGEGSDDGAIENVVAFAMFVQHMSDQERRPILEAPGTDE